MKNVTTDVAQVCTRCESELAPNATFCTCGRPTPLASFKERAAWEAKQWRAYRDRAERD